MAQEQGVDIADVAESGTRVQGDGSSDGGHCCQKKRQLETQNQANFLKVINSSLGNDDAEM